MTAGPIKNVFVLPNITGPTGLFELVNILNTGPTGLAGPTGPAAAGISGPTGGFFPVWGQLTGPAGSSGPTGNFKTVCYAGATFRKGLKTVIIPGYSAGGGAAGSAFNPADKLNIALTGTNLIATSTSASNGGVRGTTSHSVGKWMLSFSAVSIGSTDTLDYVGIGTLADTLGLASGSQVQAILTKVGTAFSGNGGSAASYPDGLAIPAAATVDLCVDLPNLLFWFRVNGGLWNASGTANPATGVGGHAMLLGGTFVPYVRITTVGQTVTLNTTPASPPAGFAAWG